MANFLLKCPIWSRSLFFIATMFAFDQLKAQTFSWARQIAGANATVNTTYDQMDVNGNMVSVINFSGIVDFDPGVATLNLNSSNGSYAIQKLNAAGNLISVTQINLPQAVRQVILDTDETIYVTGTYSGTIDADPGAGVYNLASVGYQDIFVIKLDASGNFAWARSMGGPGIDEGNCIAVNSTGSVYITGTFGYIGNTNLSPTADFDPDPSNAYILTSSGAREGFICCLDGNGDFLWAQKQPVSGMVIDAADNIYLRGAWGLPPGSANTTWFSKIDASGNNAWSKQVSSGPLEMTDFAVNSAGEVLFSGGYSGNTFIGSYNLVATSMQDPYVAKLDNAGNVVWAKQITGNGFAQQAVYGSDGNVYLTGYFVGTGNHDFDPGPASYNLNAKGTTAAFIEKLTASGDFIWVKQIGGEAKSNTSGRRLMTTTNGDIYSFFTFTGSVDFDPGAAKLNVASKGQKDLVIHKMTQNLAGRSQLVENKVDPFHFEKLSVYPNPNRGNFFIDLPVAVKADVHIYDITGHLIYSKTFSATKSILINELRMAGTYSVRIALNGKIYNTKITIQ